MTSRADTMEYVLEIHRPGPRHQDVDGIVEYVVRTPEGDGHTIEFDWDELRPLLAALEAGTATAAEVQCLGHLLRGYVTTAEWALPEASLSAAPPPSPGQDRDHHHFIVRSSAAEIYTVPWELMTLASTGQHLSELPHVNVSLAWPRVARPNWHRHGRSAPHGRVLMAWSAAAGVVPAAEHIEALAHAAGGDTFNRSRDVLAHVSAETLRAELANRDKPPVAVLHVLCHGAAVDDTFGLALASGGGDADASMRHGGATVVDAGWVRRVVGPHAGHIRMAVLCACHSGNPGRSGNHLGSVAQVLHRAGIEYVIASRFPLHSNHSVRFARDFYQGLFALGNPSEVPVPTLFAKARSELAAMPGPFDWAALQLYTASGAAVRSSMGTLVAVVRAAIIGIAAAVAVAVVGALLMDRAPAFTPWKTFADRGGLVLLRELEASPAAVAAFDALCHATNGHANLVRCHKVTSWAQHKADIRTHALESKTSVIARLSEDHQEPFIHIIAVQGPDGAPWWLELAGLRQACHSAPSDQETASLAQTLLSLAAHLGQQPGPSGAAIELASPHTYTPEVAILISWLRARQAIPATDNERGYVRNHIQRCRKSPTPLATWDCALAHYLHYGVYCTQQVPCPSENVDHELRHLADTWRQSTIGRAASATWIQRAIHGADSDAAFAELTDNLPVWDNLPSNDCFRLTMMELANELPARAQADEEQVRQRLACPVAVSGQAQPRVCQAKQLTAGFPLCARERIANALLFRGKAFAQRKRFDDAAAQLRQAIDIELAQDSPVKPVLLLWWAESELHREQTMAGDTRKEIFQRLQPLVKNPAAPGDRGNHGEGSDDRMGIRTHMAYVSWLASLAQGHQEDAAHDLWDVYRDARYAPMKEDPSVAELARRAGPRAQWLYREVITQGKTDGRQTILQDVLFPAITHSH